MTFLSQLMNSARPTASATARELSFQQDQLTWCVRCSAATVNNTSNALVRPYAISCLYVCAAIMGVLVSCCLRLMGYDNLGGAAVVQTSRRKQELNAILSDRDGRRPTLSRYIPYVKTLLFTLTGCLHFTAGCTTGCGVYTDL